MKNVMLATILHVNIHGIFLLHSVSGGKVQLRDFSVNNPWAHKPAAKARKKDASLCYKTTLCWFHGNHPDGCPRQAEKCNFAHGFEELRPRVEPK